MPVVVLFVVSILVGPLPSAMGGEHDQPAMEPAEAITLARAYLAEADETRDVQAARRGHLAAAAVLRSGILGMHRLRDDRATVEHLPHLYRLYVLTLTRLEMRHHAAVAALAGTDQALSLIGRFGQQGRSNPWMRVTGSGRIAWDYQDVTPVGLATDGLTIAGQLKSRAPGMSGLYQAMLSRLSSLDPPPCEGSHLSRSSILALVAEEDYETALRETAHLLQARPDQDLWVFAVRSVAIPAWAQHLRREGQTARADDLLDRLAHEESVIRERMRSDLAQPDLPPARRAEVERMMHRLGRPAEALSNSTP